MPSTSIRASTPSPIGSSNQTALRRETHPASSLGSADLFRSCSAGNCDRAWQEFVERFHSRLVTAVRRALLRLGVEGPYEERVEDLVQEIYCRLLGAGRRTRCFRGSSEAQLMTYLQRVATSVVVDDRRVALAGKRWGGHRVAWTDWQLVAALGVAAESGPEDRLLDRERRRTFLGICRHALGRRANSTTVKIARLALLEGWTSREIAAGLGGQMGVAGVDSIIYRLRRRLAGRGIALPRRDGLPST